MAYGDQNGKSRAARKSASVGDGYDADFRGYINLSLSDADKAHFDDWWAGSEPWETLEAVTADGVNLAIKKDPRSEGFLASATQRRRGSPNAGLCVTARGRTAAIAWGRLLFSLWVLSAKESWEATQPMADPDRW